jgi:hypothetical protein
LLFRAPFDKDQPTRDYVADLVEGLHGICCYIREYLKMTRDRTKARYDHLTKSAEFLEDGQVWLHRPTWTRRESPKLQPSWEGAYKMVNWINDIVYTIEGHPVVNIWLGNGTQWRHV